MVEMPEQNYRSVGGLATRDFGHKWQAVVYIVLQSQGVDVELPGVGFNGSITGVGVWFPGVIVLELFLAMWIDRKSVV